MTTGKHALYETDKVRFYLDPEIPCLVNEWRGFLSSEEFRTAIKALVVTLKQLKGEYPHLNLLADTRNLAVVKPDDVQWVTDEINSEYLRAGATHEAFVLSKDMFGQAAVNRYSVQTTKQGNFTVKLFAEMEEAKAWLQQFA